MQETQVWSLSREDPLGKEMATHSSVLAWRIPGTGGPGGLPSMGSHRVGHDWSDLAAAALQHTRLPSPSPSPGACSNSCPWSQRCYPTILSSVIPFFSCLQSFPASGSFQMSQFFTSGGQRIRASASASVLPMNIQDWSPLGWIGWISLQFKGFSRIFSSTTVQKHQFFGAQLSSQSNSHIHTWPQEKT